MIAILLAALLFAIPPALAASPDPGADGWQTASPSETGLDAKRLEAIGPRFDRAPEFDLHAVLVARHGKLVLERYFTGPDERRGRPLGVVQYDGTQQHDLRSITKSVTSLLLGIAIGQGKIPDLDQPVLDAFPDHADLRTPAKNRITLRHLLTMSQGLRWNEDLPVLDPNNDELRMDESADPVRYILSRPVDTPAGLVFNYSGGSAMLIAASMRRATGQSLDDFARSFLFEPLGIRDFEWDRRGDGVPFAASGLRMRPRDTVKLGQLVLNHGAWNGKQVVPADWIEAATKPHINAGLNWFYGYQFWLGRSLVREKPVDWIAGVGLGGQRLFIVPALDLVVLVHAGLYHAERQAAGPMTVLNGYVLPAVQDVP